MERTVFVERVERDAAGTIVEAFGIVEMLGKEARWEAERVDGASRWVARLAPGQLPAEDKGWADMFLDDPPLRDDIDREIHRTQLRESCRRP